MKNEPRARYGWLYVIFGLMVLLFTVESNLALSGALHIAAQVIVLAVVVFLTDVWIKTNLPLDTVEME